MLQADWQVPVPEDKAFIKMVQREIAQADERALESWQEWMKGASGRERQALNRRKHNASQKVETKRRYIRKPIYKTEFRKFQKDCAGCGGHLDNYTTGCRTCQRRHNARRKMINARNSN